MMAPAFTPVDLEAPDQNAWMACKSSSFTITNCTHKGRDLHQYASPVALAVYASMLDLQPALETKLLPSMLRVSFLRASDSYVISYPSLLARLFDHATRAGLEAHGEDDNTITLSGPNDFTAITKERSSGGITFGFVRMPHGAIDTDADVEATTKHALESVGLRLNNFERRLDKYGISTSEYSIRFDMTPSFDPSLLRKIRAEVPRTSLLNTPIHIVLSKEFAAEISICTKCHFKRCICAALKPNSGMGGKANHANAFARLLKRQRDA